MALRSGASHVALEPARALRAALSACIAVVFACTPALAQRAPDASSWVWRDQASGRLLYRTTQVGDRILDFSGTGYMGGAQPVPDADALVPPARRITVAPPARGDAGQAIQAAIDKAAAWPADLDGFRGLVQLAPGTFDIEDQIRIESGGIILRGTKDTRLRATGTSQRSLIFVGHRQTTWPEVADSRSEVIDRYVPVGAASLRVADPRRFQAGEDVVVLRPATPEWISAIGMDRIPPRPDERKVAQWPPSGLVHQQYERRIERIEGDRLFFDAPLPTSLDRIYGVAAVYRYDASTRIERVGLIELHGEATYNPALKDRSGRYLDEDHAWTFIDVTATRNAWVERVSARHFSFAAVVLRRFASQVTVRQAASYLPVSKVTGQRRYAFTNDGQRNLMQDLYSEQSRHDFASAVPSRGPNVFLRGRAVGSVSESGPHQRWSTGTLFDRIEVAGTTASLAAYNAGNRGSAHGHSGANMVFWNSSAPRLQVENPPTAQNWVVGSRGQVVDPDDFLRVPLAYYDREGQTPALGDPARNPENSLFIAQRLDRARFPGGSRRAYAAGDYTGGSGAGELTVAIGRDAREAVAGGAVRFAARRVGAGPAVLTVGGESLKAPVLVTYETGDVVMGTAVMSDVALLGVQERGSIALNVPTHLRLLWAETELDFVPATVSKERQPAGRVPVPERR